MATMFKVKYGTPRPIAVDCETPSYPERERDADGDQILNNTHFLSEDDAWETLLREHDAGQYLAVRNVQRLREELAAAEKELCDAAILATAARNAFQART